MKQETGLSEAALQELVQATLRELRPEDPALPRVTLSSRLVEDLGFDSLARMELLQRAEQAFGVELPSDTLASTDTVQSLLAALRQARPALRRRGAPAPVAVVPPIAERAVTLADLVGAGTLLEVLERHLQAHPDQVHIHCLGEADDVEAISYRQLHERALCVAAGLQHAGVRPGQTVALMLPTGPDYFPSYFGVLYAGAVPVPIYPPARLSQLEEHVRRHAGILANAQAVVLVTVPQGLAVARLLRAQVPTLQHVSTPHQLLGARPAPAPRVAKAEDVAFIQYTSGSTGNPKGVVLTHGNLLANIRAMQQAAGATPQDVFVSWLPLYHDMGLIGAWLSSLTVGFPLVVMSPLAFLARPRRWLEALTQWRGTLSAGPNFAYELCLKRITDDELEGLDLRAWRLAFNGAEAVSASTVQRFSQRFARCGLRAEAMAPVYGLAEASVGLLFPPIPRVAPVDLIVRETFTREHRAVPAQAGDASALHFVACGRPLPGHEVRIVDDEGHDVGERVEGRLEFRGPSATAGYFENPEASARLRRDGWLDTADRAYRAAGDIYITGRVKDIVIRGGRNLYPEEIEEAVGAVPGVRKGCVAVFGVPDAATGTERLVVLAETRGPTNETSGALREAVAAAVVSTIGEPADEVLLAPPHTVLKTSSGKVRRSACRELVLAGQVGAKAHGALVQALRLVAMAMQARLQRGWVAAARGLGALRLSLAFWLMVLPAWMLVLLMPSTAAAWAMARRAARAVLVLGGVPLDVRGLERLPAGGCVLVSNHASYADGAILVAALPRPFAFVAKRELEGQFVAGPFLRRLGAVFVERFEVTRSVQDATRLAEMVRDGRALAFFPEGTFVATPGLLPFHLGAFAAAARAGVPIVPVALHGNRELLPDGSWWPRPAALEVNIGEAIPVPADAPDAFAAAVAMRDAARRSIEAGCP